MFYKVARFIIAIFLRIIFRFDVEGLENIPEDEAVMICSNHVSNWDPFVISVAYKNRQIHWMAKAELFQIKIVGWILDKAGVFPIEREETDISAIKKSFRILKDEKVLGIFPEGTRISDGFNIDNVKTGASMIAMRTESLIVPVHIESNYRLFSKVRIRFGEPKDYFSDLEARPNHSDYEKASEDLLRTIYSL